MSEHNQLRKALERLLSANEGKDNIVLAMHERCQALKAQAAQPAEVTDEQIESEFQRCGGKWSGDQWVLEDADLHPFARAILALRPTAVPMREGTARQFVEWMKAQPEDREPTTIDGALDEFQANLRHFHSITDKASKKGGAV